MWQRSAPSPLAASDAIVRGTKLGHASFHVHLTPQARLHSRSLLRWSCSTWLGGGGRHACNTGPQASGRGAGGLPEPCKSSSGWLQHVA
jgi:hypothetical protein